MKSSLFALLLVLTSIHSQARTLSVFSAACPDSHEPNTLGLTSKFEFQDNDLLQTFYSKKTGNLLYTSISTFKIYGDKIVSSPYKGISESSEKIQFADGSEVAFTITPEIYIWDHKTDIKTVTLKGIIPGFFCEKDQEVTLVLK